MATERPAQQAADNRTKHTDGTANTPADIPTKRAAKRSAQRTAELSPHQAAHVAAQQAARRKPQLSTISAAFESTIFAALSSTQLTPNYATERSTKQPTLGTAEQEAQHTALCAAFSASYLAAEPATNCQTYSCFRRRKAFRIHSPTHWTAQWTTDRPALETTDL